jgi:hypothetical protein
MLNEHHLILLAVARHSLPRPRSLACLRLFESGSTLSIHLSTRGSRDAR